MSVDVTTVLTALKTRLATIDGLEVRDHVVDIPVAPMAVPALGPIDFDEAMSRGLDHYEFSVAVIIDKADSETAVTNLMAYAAASGTKSIKAAIEGATSTAAAFTLGGVVSSARVSRMEEPGHLKYGDVLFLYVEFKVQVHS